MKAFLIVICILEAIAVVNSKDWIVRLIAGALGVWAFYLFLGVVNYL